MNAYAIVLQLSVSHAYFPAASNGNFRVEATARCAALLDRLGILARPAANGLLLLCQSAAREELLAGLAQQDELEFQVFSGDSHFFLYTALDRPAPDACLYFHSAQAQQEQPGCWRLHAQDYADQSAWSDPVVPNKMAGLAARSFRPLKPVFFLALSPVQLAGALASGGTPRFCVRFQARKMHWKYYLLRDPGVPHAAIVDLDGELRFTARGYTALPGNGPALTFVSEQAIEMRQTHAQRLQLREQGELGERILIKRLPNASVAAVGREIAAGSAVAVLVSEIYIP
ncbi:hypothetical protein [Janthinobacterium sp. GW458P]|uniref:hypothetical protein n=1 Tax=Janthinobacterium sp. GW458P TaxID=1981504 RepID=UPI000A322E70|nr:hypothetical protein [Janthinobacterium sp. GW458P]MBE3024391.1 hypothetical protein [Janthinobacterium sp. GW458P]